MTTTSDNFLEALNKIVKDYFPVKLNNDFTIKLPLNKLPVDVYYNSFLTESSAHETMMKALFLQKVKDLFKDEQPGCIWLKEADFLQKPGEDFGFYTPEEINEKSYTTQHITTDNTQPIFRFGVHEKWAQIDTVFFRDGRLHKGQKNPISTEFKTLKKQKELQKFFHLLSAFKGPMKLWRTYYYKTNVTLRAPTREAACFLTQAILNSKKSLKSETYEVENSYKIFCSPIEPESVIQKYQEDMKAIRI